MSDLDTIRRVFTRLTPSERQEALGTQFSQWGRFRKSYFNKVRDKLIAAGYDIEKLEEA